MATNAGGAKAEAASPEALLKAAVSGSGAAPAEPVASSPAASSRVAAGRDRRTLAAATGALLLGGLLGFGAGGLAAPRDAAAPMLATLAAGLEADRAAAAHTGAEIDKLRAALASLGGTVDGFRAEAGTRAVALDGRLTEVEQRLAGKVAAVRERVEQAERDDVARAANLVAQIEKRPAATPAPVALTPTKPDPVQTGSLPEAKPKPAVVEGWALRDVYNGVAILEDRRRRLIEVATGDTVPGAGRVENIERRGRDWVVVTRGGLVTAQRW